ncbi:MAG: lytic transglycosylase domain-containing protein, partial [Thermaerobacterales bacterium]
EANALSPADAYGLMQIVPDTAAMVARQIGYGQVEAGDLFDPAVNVELGTAFLADLLRRYPDPRMAVGAYHAGPGRMDRWVRTMDTSDMMAFVEAIPIESTRQYVKAVDRSFLMYHALYGSR